MKAYFTWRCWIVYALLSIAILGLSAEPIEEATYIRDFFWPKIIGLVAGGIGVRLLIQWTKAGKMPSFDDNEDTTI